MKYDLETGAHSAYSLHYYLILTTKYRQGVLTEDRIDFMRRAIENFADPTTSQAATSTVATTTFTSCFQHHRAPNCRSS